MAKEIIPIVFSTDSSFALYCYLAIYSVIKASNSKYEYRIFILEADLDDKEKELLESLSKDGISVKCVNIKRSLEHVSLKRAIDRLSIETYYRLFISKMFPEYKRIIYLDVDLYVLKDVASLLAIDMGGKPIAAAHDYNSPFMRNHMKDVGFDCVYDVFNAGVLVIDTEVFEKERIREYCLKLLGEDHERETHLLTMADQDALNLVVKGNVAWIDQRWNVQVQHESNPEYRIDYNGTEENDDSHEAYIIHFAGENKAWHFPSIDQSMYFWRLAGETRVFSEILQKAFFDNVTRIYGKYQFPYNKISANSKIVLYGAGVVGQQFYRQMQLTNYAQIVLWVDRNSEKLRDQYEVSCIEMISTVEYDVVLIAIKDDNKVLDAMNALENYDVPRYLIVRAFDS